MKKLVKNAIIRSANQQMEGDKQMNKYFKLLAWTCAGIVAGATIYFSYEGAAILAVAAGVFKGFAEFMKG